jgi:ATP-dependent helicase/DNAse subunit B
MEQKTKGVKERILSASRLKTLETCSWSYWCNYHLKLPQKQNEGALRGTVCHLVFEMLVKKKHKKHFNKISKAGTIKASEAVHRMVMKHLTQMEKSFDLPMTNEENTELVDDMIVVGLKCDFFGWGGKVDKPELEFLLESKDPEYKIRGFIDKPIVYKKGKKIKIVDYKSSKYKFRGEELHSNVQAMVYTLAAQKEWPGYTPTVEFQFLRHPKSPLQQLKFNEDQLRGLEYYLAHTFQIVNNFTEETAITNYAADKKKDSWLCKIGKWRCPYIDPYDYFVIVDKNKEEIKKSFKKKELQNVLKKGDKIEKRTYEGCPRHKPTTEDNILDMFA